MIIMGLALIETHMVAQGKAAEPGLRLSGGAHTAPALSSPGSHVGPGDRQYSGPALAWCVAPCWTSGWGI